MRYELIIYWSKAANSFLVEVPELPGCMADGANYEEGMLTVRFSREPVNPAANPRI